MKRNLIIAAILVSALTACSQKTEQEDFTKWVNTSIGTGGHGHVFVGANVPFGAVQLGPTSIPQTWDWCSGYHVSDSTVIGFSHTHLNGTGIGDLFDVTVLPLTTGECDYSREGIADKADRDTEVCVPGYYSVKLRNSGVKVELTATARVGLHRYIFPEGAKTRSILVDLENGGCWDAVTDETLEQTGKTTFNGHRHSTGWADNQKLWFSGEFSEPYTSCSEVAPHHYRFEFSPGTKEVMLKVAISPKSVEGALSNMQAELAGWDFEAVKKTARDAWNSELSKVRIQTADKDNRTIFYTALYHSMTAPSLFCDNGEPARYTTFSLWDTYRAQMPLMTILQPEREKDFINTFLDIYDAQGKLPVWHLMGCETDCMVGNPGIPVVADAILKGFEGFDVEKAYEAMKVSAMRPDRGQQYRIKYGYLPCDLFGNESVAYDMEYALADWALAQVALKLGHDEDYTYFLERSKSYRHLFDKELGFVRGTDSKGRFREPFNPFYATHRANDYCEGNAWQYTWLVPHDFKGLCECFGGKAKLLVKLDSLFVVDSKLEGEDASPDISGLIGQYAHGNEPSHHILYFYTLAGQPWKTADLVRRTCREMYFNAPDGLSGNEDVGQMSAWYILSSLGFYQVEPAGGRYYFGSPLFDSAKLSVAGGEFSIVAKDNSESNKYIQRVFLNGMLYTKAYIDYADIAAGGEIVFEMGSEPKIWYNPDEPSVYADNRPAPEKRLFTSPALEKEIAAIAAQIENPRLRWMFVNCFPNTLDTTVHYGEDGEGNPDTFVYTGDIPAMWLRDSGAQVWPYLEYANDDPALKKMIAGTINRQFKLICIDPYANAFNVDPVGPADDTDIPKTSPYVFERKWEIDSQCYPIRLAYAYWKKTGDTSVFGKVWEEAAEKILATLREQQRYEGHGSYTFLRITDRQLDTKCVVGQGNPVKPVGLIASAFRPSDDATTFEYLIPSNFMAVTSLRKAAEILSSVNRRDDLAQGCRALADEVEQALRKYAVVEHPKYGKIYAYEVDGFGSCFLMDDANVPSLLAMAYLGDVSADDPIYQNTRRFVWSEDNPYFFRGPAGEGIGGPHIGTEMIWPMSIMMKAFTSSSDEELRDCIAALMTTDAGTGFMHESFHRNNAADFTREWFAWQNTLFGELIAKTVREGRVHVLNSIK